MGEEKKGQFAIKMLKVKLTRAKDDLNEKEKDTLQAKGRGLVGRWVGAQSLFVKLAVVLQQIWHAYLGLGDPFFKGSRPDLQGIQRCDTTSSVI